jgi:hypothetical protein
VDDDIRLGLRDGPADGVRVEDVEHDGFCADGANVTDLRTGSRRSDDLVPVATKQRDEPLPDRSRRACDEDPHDLAPFARFVL